MTHEGKPVPPPGLPVASGAVAPHEVASRPVPIREHTRKAAVYSYAPLRRLDADTEGHGVVVEGLRDTRVGVVPARVGRAAGSSPRLRSRRSHKNAARKGGE